MERRPCLFRRKGWREGEFFEKAKGMGVPEKEFLLLEVHGYVEGGKRAYGMRWWGRGEDWKMFYSWLRLPRKRF